MIKTKVAFLEGRLFSNQSELFEYFLNCSDWLDKSRTSTKTTFVLIMETGYKCFWFCFFLNFRAYCFTSNSAVFVGGGANIFLPPGAWHPSYTTDKIIGVGLLSNSSLLYIYICILNKIKKLGKI